MKEKLVIYALMGGFGAIGGDLESFKRARKLDPAVRFEWDLMIIKFLRGAVIVAAGAIGYTAATGQEPTV